MVIGGLYILHNDWDEASRINYNLKRYERQFPISRLELETIKKNLIKYKEKNGSFPSNEEGLSVLNNVKEEYRENNPENAYSGHPPGPYISNNLILSSFKLPYIYENRTGLPKEAFSHSPAERDTGNYYSTKVADGIYVYCAGMLRFYDDYIALKEQFRKNRWIIIVTGISMIISGLILLAIFSKRLSEEKLITITGILWIAIGVLAITIMAFTGFLFFAFFAGIMILLTKWISISPAGIFRAIKIAVLIILAAISALFFGAGNLVSCYRPAPVGQWRRKALYPDYLELLAKYRDNKVIKQETFYKIKQILDSELEHE